MSKILGEDETFQEEGNFFEKTIANPNQPQETDLDFLEEIISKYPYFQTGRLIYTKLLKDTRSFKFHEALKTTAIYSPNRTMLFKYLNPHIASPAHPPVPSGIDQDDLTEEQLAFFSENIGPKPTEENLVDFDANSSSNDHSENLTEKNAADIPHTSSHRDISNIPVESSIPKSKPITKASIPSESGKSLSTNRQLDLMNKFIQQNPKISPSKVDYSEENNHAIPISEDFKNQSLMTETLAQVYTEQGLYDKAIRTYRLLSLKYPHKSGYFADQIKKIQQKK